MLMKALALGLTLSLAGCSSTVPIAADESELGLVSPWTQVPVQSAIAIAPNKGISTVRTTWQHRQFPGKAPNQFTYVRQEGRHTMMATAQSSASMLRQTVRIEPSELGRVNFSWKVPELIAQADMALREADDSPVRIVLAFEGDRAKFSAKNSMLSELSHALTGEPMPYATLMYVWCNTRAPGSVIVNPRTDRIRKLVVESGGKRLNQWLDYERDIRADYEKAFGEAPGALVGVGIMTDSDNTHSATRAWYGPLTLAALK